ncbi:MAG: GAF domain-containing protein [Sporichthyaceae bacterium]
MTSTEMAVFAGEDATGQPRLIRAVRDLAAARGLDDIVHIVRTAARQVADADGATFVLRDNGRCYYVDEDAIEPLWSGLRFPMEACISGWAMLNAQQVIIPDIYLDSRIPHDAYRPTFVRSLAMTPIRTADPVGAIGVYWASEREATPAERGMLQALADSTAVAMENVRVIAELEERRAAEARKREEWLQACLRITHDLLDPAAKDPLPAIAEQARAVAGADSAYVALLDPAAAEVVLAVVADRGGVERSTRRFPVAATFSGVAVDTGQPLLVEDASRVALGDAVRSVAGDNVGPAMVVPLIAAGRVRGTLVMTRYAGGPTFDEIDVDQATAFANHAAIALEFADARAAKEELAVREERDRIARDLHDDVIQRLFVAGMSLQSLLSFAEEGPYAERLERSIAEIDTTIGGIRSLIYRMRTPLGDTSTDLRDRVLQVLADVGPLFVSTPSLRFSGPLDTMVDDEVVEDVEAVLRESLTNVAKHAAASHTWVELSVDLAARRLVVQVTDDGVGFGEPSRRSGTANLLARAQNRGGECDISSPAVEGRGTRVRWTVPVG